MKPISPQTLRDAGIKTQAAVDALTPKEREYLLGWDEMDPETRQQLRRQGILPDLGQRGMVVRKTADEHDPFATLVTATNDTYYDEPPPESEAEYPLSGMVKFLQRVLYALYESRHFRLDEQAKELTKRFADRVTMFTREDLHQAAVRSLQAIISGEVVQPPTIDTKLNIPLQAELLLAINNRSTFNSQADIARAYTGKGGKPLTRAAINNQIGFMRTGPWIQDLKNYHFGGNPEVSEKNKERANKYYEEQRNLKSEWTPTTTIKSFVERVA